MANLNPFDASDSAASSQPPRRPSHAVTFIGAVLGGLAGLAFIAWYGWYTPPAERARVLGGAAAWFVVPLMGSATGLVLGRVVQRALMAAHAFDTVEFRREELRMEIEQTKSRLTQAAREESDDT